MLRLACSLLCEGILRLMVVGKLGVIMKKLEFVWCGVCICDFEVVRFILCFENNCVIGMNDVVCLFVVCFCEGVFWWMFWYFF